MSLIRASLTVAALVLGVPGLSQAQKQFTLSGDDVAVYNLAGTISVTAGRGDEVTVAIQVNGKLRDTLTVAKGGDRAALEALALGSPKIAAILAGASPKKVIVVPDRLVNIVA